MKRWLLLLVIPFLLSSCNNYNDEKALKAASLPFEDENIILRTGNKEFKGTASRNGNGDLRLSLWSEDLKVPVTFLEEKEASFLFSGEFYKKTKAEKGPSRSIYESFEGLEDAFIFNDGNLYHLVNEPFETVVDIKKERIVCIMFPMGKLNFML